MFTTLAVIFVVVLLGFILYGFGFIMRRPPGSDGVPQERCSICRSPYRRQDLVERAVGDSRLYYFCRPCIESLSRDASTLPHL